MCVYIYMCVYICVYIYTHTHTHTHTTKHEIFKILHTKIKKHNIPLAAITD